MRIYATLIPVNLQMPSSKPEKHPERQAKHNKESCYSAQLGLDFIAPSNYSEPPRKEQQTMNPELLQALENKINDVVGKYNSLKEENNRLQEENQRLQSEREGVRTNIDSLLGKLEGI